MFAEYLSDSFGTAAFELLEPRVLLSTTYYVDQANPLADDANPGTEASPFLTINKAIGLVDPGDTILIKEGVYYERLNIKRSGAAGSPITMKAAEGEQVVVSGAGKVEGWEQSDLTIAKGNPFYENIYYVDINWLPTRLVQDSTDLTKSRTPNEGWWSVEQDGTTTTLIDTVNLTQPDDYWVGGEVYLWDVDITAQYTKTITDFDSATGTITVGSNWYGSRSADSDDRYYLQNKVEIIDTPGEWAVEDMGNGTYRLYVWAQGGEDPDNYLMEASKHTRFVIEFGRQSYWNVEDLEIRHGQQNGIGGWNSGGLGHNNVTNCYIHHNDAMGIYGRYNDYAEYKNNLVTYNGNGISNVGSSHVLIQNNEVAWNGADGIRTIGPSSDGSSWAQDVTVRGNYIHDHFLWSHPDNAQAHDHIRDLLIEDNLFLNAGQNYMMSDTEYATFRNNMILGSAAYAVILGHGSVFNTNIENNTFFALGYGAINLSGDGFDFHNNIYMSGHTGTMFSNVSPSYDYSSDYNIFYHADGLTQATVPWDGNYSIPHDQYVAASGQDTHSAYANPMFANAPYDHIQLDTHRQHEFTTTRVYLNLPQESSLVEVGDNITIDWDGVMRTVTAVGSDYVEFDIPSEQAALKSMSIQNWKDITDSTLDLSLLPGSPAIGAASDGGNIGSSVNVPQYMAGDFDGDGVRDLPAWPGGTGYLVGDFNEDNQVNAIDIDMLWAARGGGDMSYDLTGDSTVDNNDVDMLVLDILNTNYGDTDLNHAVDLVDLVTLGENWNQTGGWSLGDTNGDLLIDLVDLVTVGENWSSSSLQNNDSSQPSPAALPGLTPAKTSEPVIFRSLSDLVDDDESQQNLLLF